MIIGNKKPMVVIGYEESSTTEEFIQLIEKTNPCEVIKPLDFYSITEKSKYQYIVSVTFDWAERLEVTNFLKKEGLDMFTVIHDTCVIGNKPAPIIGNGTFIFPYVIIGLAASVGKNCIIGSQSMVGHHSALGDCCWIKPGSMVLGKSHVGNNCILNARTTITNSIKITNDVEIGACSYVRKDINASGRYAGNPLKKLIH